MHWHPLGTKNCKRRHKSEYLTASALTSFKERLCLHLSPHSSCWIDSKQHSFSNPQKWPVEQKNVGRWMALTYNRNRSLPFPFLRSSVPSSNPHNWFAFQQQLPLQLRPDWVQEQQNQKMLVIAVPQWDLAGKSLSIIFFKSHRKSPSTQTLVATTMRLWEGRVSQRIWRDRCPIWPEICLHDQGWPRAMGR